ncbi:MAG: hypothetical protein ACXWL9_05435, partial [Syntrophales bacterium]
SPAAAKILPRMAPFPQLIVSDFLTKLIRKQERLVERSGPFAVLRLRVPCLPAGRRNPQSEIKKSTHPTFYLLNCPEQFLS